MSDLTNTPKVRTPAYAASAERFNAERELGRRVLDSLRRWRMDPCVTDEAFADTMDAMRAIESDARALGLLPEARP